MARSPFCLNAMDRQLIQMALAEDLHFPPEDVTTDLLFKDKKQVTAHIISKHHAPIILCGLPVIQAIIQSFHAELALDTAYQDGDSVIPGQVLLTLRGSANALLKLERLILNFLQLLCAIAGYTFQFVSKIQHTPTQILDTRKTIPGFRHLAKYAVQCGGGVNHRMGLYDAVMVKDTHVDAVGGMKAALAYLPDTILEKYPVIIEVRNAIELDIVLQEARHKISRILLDNMHLQELIKNVSLCKGIVATEASGNINLENVLEVAETGVDFISIGKLTHSSGSVDLSMMCEIKK